MDKVRHDLKIARFIDDDLFEQFLLDLGFLFNFIIKQGYEYDLKLRKNSFNLYYRGSSLVRVSIKKEGYVASINKKFVEDNTFGENKFDEPKCHGDYKNYHLSRRDIHPFLKQSNISKISRAIKNVNYGEENTFEQNLIIDNINRDDFVIIDRQVIVKGEKESAMDLLVLRLNEESKLFHFFIIEAKLGKNPELSSKVGNQLERYISLLRKHIDDFKACYEKTFFQLRKAGLIQNPDIDTIEIDPNPDSVCGCVAVGGYSGLAAPMLNNLRKHHPDLIVQQFQYRIS